MAQINFENNIDELERLITELEKGDLSLEDSEKKITVLLEENGELKEENFEGNDI